MRREVSHIAELMGGSHRLSVNQTLPPTSSSPSSFLPPSPPSPPPPSQSQQEMRLNFMRAAGICNMIWKVCRDKKKTSAPVGVLKCNFPPLLENYERSTDQ